MLNIENWWICISKKILLKMFDRLWSVLDRLSAMFDQYRYRIGWSEKNCWSNLEKLLLGMKIWKKLDLYCRTITNVKIRNYPWWHHVESEVTYALLCHLQLFIYVVKQAGENCQKFEEFLQGSLTGRRRAKPGSLVTTKVSASARPTTWTISWNGDFDALPTRSRWDDGRILTFNYL